MASTEQGPDEQAAGPTAALAQTELGETVLAALRDRKGIAPAVADVRSLTPVTDFMVIVGGRSGRHVRSLVDRVLEAVKQRGLPVLGVEGREASYWVLIDLVDVVVHVMREQARDFYDLERLWEADEAPAPAQLFV